MAEEYYSINQLSFITGFSTRTLRNYIKDGTLCGQMKNGAWYFSDSQIESFLSNANVAAGLYSKRKSLIYHFLQDIYKETNQICIILDFAVSLDESEEISNFFINQIDNHIDTVQFFKTREGRVTRIILSGPEETVLSIINEYYKQ